ncbi:MAG TPA: hypothetical protein DCS93_28845 [Microscillaceae bacterium]|nr:hypothetical protein [Microscillaceae bacterium]
MITYRKIYYILILAISISLLGCQLTNKNQDQNQLTTGKLVKASKVTTQASNPVETPAVIYRSTDLGVTWSAFAQGIPATATLSGIKQSNSKLYVTTDHHGIFVYTDDQSNWQQLGPDTLKNLDINCIEIEKNKLVIGTLHQGVLVSHNGGRHWMRAKINIKNSHIRAFIKAKGKLYAGTDSGIFESNDMGNTWSHHFGSMQILGFTALNDKIYAATQHGVLVGNGEASNWKSIYNGDALHDISNDGKYIYAMTIGQQLLKTKNDGISWENAQNGITYPTNYYTNELKHIGSNIFSAQWIGIYHSTNNGNNWKKLQGLPDSTAFSTLEITDYGIIAGISIR